VKRFFELRAAWAVHSAPFDNFGYNLFRNDDARRSGKSIFVISYELNVFAD
jgi:hypothetical protein